MGFVRQPKRFRLTFEGDLNGLEVIAESTGLGDFMAISELANVTTPFSAADLAKFKKLLKAFAEVLKDWNLESAPGVPVPATYEGLLKQDVTLVVAIIGSWMDAVAAGHIQVGPAEPFSEASLPVEALT